MTRIKRGLVVVCVASLGCSGGPISDAIGATVERGPGTRLVLVEQAPFVWEKVCVFGPYSGDDQIDELTGVPGAAKRAHGINSNDGINVLMFIDHGQVIESVAHPRNRGDFGPELVKTCYSREQAVFLVRRPPEGSWGDVGPLNHE